jgi:acetylornithine deacetylase/succinyl-diaminopimelate desuccinylase-like protein
LIVLIEGEEEIDSHHLAGFIAVHRDALRADVAVISDTSGFARGVPAITAGLRGLVYSQITMRAMDGDLHSGIHGGAVLNSANALARLIAALHDKQGKVALPGFYDDVRPASAAERIAWRALPVDDVGYAKGLGLVGGTKTLDGEAGFSTLERRWARPTCDICGLTSGYQGEGAKTIIPASASAKISFRLVRDQDPRKVQTALEEFARAHTPPGLVTTVDHFAAAPAALVPVDSVWMSAARPAYEIGYCVPPVIVRDGLTIPVVNLLAREFGIETILAGFGLPDDRPHAPNEKFDLDAFHCGARTIAALYGELASTRKP